MWPTCRAQNGRALDMFGIGSWVAGGDGSSHGQADDMHRMILQTHQSYKLKHQTKIIIITL